MEPLKPFEFYVDPHYWAFPLAVSYGWGRWSVAVFCFVINFGRT